MQFALLGTLGRYHNPACMYGGCWWAFILVDIILMGILFLVAGTVHCYVVVYMLLVCDCCDWVVLLGAATPGPAESLRQRQLVVASGGVRRDPLCIVCPGGCPAGDSACWQY